MKLRIVFLIGTLLFCGGCQPQRATEYLTRSDRTPTAEKSPTPRSSPPVAPKSYIKEAKLIAVGDIMMHGSQIASGYDAKQKKYNFDGFFTEVKNIFLTGHWVIGNLETTLAGAAAGGYTGYPLFNSPAELADAAKKAGFNILTTANNHSLDRGEKGVLKTLQNLRDRQLASTGTFASAKEAEKILVVTKNNISMAVLAYTYGTNGIPIPKGKDYLVSLINEKKIVQDIVKARQQGVDLITICLHFGDEYQRQPNSQQKKLVDTLVKAGADIILGSHPHVVQPYKIFELPGKDGKTRKAVAIYSMGNFISGQIGNYKDLGVIFTVNVRKKFPEKTVEISKVEAIPTWVHRYYLRGKLNFRVLPLQTIVDRRNDPILPKSEYPRLEKSLQEMKKHLQSLSNQTQKKPKD